MKNYNEMAQSVLKRRDIEIKRRRRAFLIGAPCAAAVLVGVVGVGVVAASHIRGGLISSAEPGIDEGDSMIIQSYVSSSSTEIADIAIEPADPTDYTNPNVGQTKINMIYLEDIHLDNGISVDGYDFTEYSIDTIDNFYRLRFNRFGDLYPEWELSHGKIGIYSKDYSETRAGVDVMVHECGPDRNTLNYTTKNGGKISVTVQRDNFESLSPKFAVSDESTSTSIPDPEVHTEYDENGNVIGQTIAGYDPAASRGSDQTAQPPERVNCYPEEFASTINGYDAVVCGKLAEDKVTGVDFFVADINMASNVRIIAEGLSEDEFLDILDNYTNNVEDPIKTDSESTDDTPTAPTEYTNPDAGQNDI